MRHAIPVILVLVGLLHLLPLAGVLGPERLAALYGTPIDGPDLQILMRHRAVLFGLLGGLFITAAFRPALQAAALAVGIGSVGSFVLLALGVGGFNAALARVVWADVVALVLLVVAVGLHLGAGPRAD